MGALALLRTNLQHIAILGMKSSKYMNFVQGGPSNCFASTDIFVVHTQGAAKTVIWTIRVLLVVVGASPGVLEMLLFALFAFVYSFLK